MVALSGRRSIPPRLEFRVMRWQYLKITPRDDVGFYERNASARRCAVRGHAQRRHAQWEVAIRRHRFQAAGWITAAVEFFLVQTREQVIDRILSPTIALLPSVRGRSAGANVKSCV